MDCVSSPEETSRLTREALAERKRQGMRLGRPSKVPYEVRRRIAELRVRGFTLQAIANELNAASEPTASGRTGCWGTSSVQSALATHALDREALANLSAWRKDAECPSNVRPSTASR
jgi:hypothetical protein